MKRATSSSPRVLTLLALVLGVPGVVAGCSNRQVYESLQAGQRNECQRLAEPERSKCLQSANLKYDDYATERERARPNPN